MNDACHDRRWFAGVKRNIGSADIHTSDYESKNGALYHRLLIACNLNRVAASRFFLVCQSCFECFLAGL